MQRPRIGHLGLAGAVACAYSYVFFTSTVVYALIARTPSYQDLTRVFGAWMTVHGLIMLAGGLAFGLAVARAGVLPRWTGIALMAGVILVAAAAGLPTPRGPRRPRSPTPPSSAWDSPCSAAT